MSSSPTLGYRLRELRVLHNIGLGDLASRADLTTAHVTEVEADLAVPSYELLEHWARALEVPFYRLFFSSLDAVWTPRLSARLSLDELQHAGIRGVSAILPDWLRYAADTLLGRERCLRENQNNNR